MILGYLLLWISRLRPEMTRLDQGAISAQKGSLAAASSMELRRTSSKTCKDAAKWMNSDGPSTCGEKVGFNLL